MAIFKCKMCGGDLHIEETDKVIECDYCGTTQTVPSADSEKKLTLFNRANRLRLAGEFDKAAGIYENIVAEFPEEAEAYWGLCLCNYGIEYVDDPSTGKKIPTCHRASFEKLTRDENFELAMEYADVRAQKVYRDEAREIDRINEEILSVSKNETPYDLFICYKETDESGNRTPDSVMAQDVYDALTARGYKVFFARISLEDKLGQQYEPYIFAALNSAKIMLCVGTKYEYFHAVWVKNEWSRFVRLAAKDKSKVLIPCYKDMDPYDLPDGFKGLQAQDLGKLGAIQDLVRGVEKLLVTDTPVAPAAPMQAAVINPAAATVDSLLKRAFIFLEDQEWESADEYAEKVLDIDPENGEAYLVKTLAVFKIVRIEDIVKSTLFLEDARYFLKAIKYSASETKDRLTTIFNEKKRQDELEHTYQISFHKYKKATKISDYEEAKKGFEVLGDYKDSIEIIKLCELECLYQAALRKMQQAKNAADFEEAQNAFEKLKGYKDSDVRNKVCKEKVLLFKASENADTEISNTLDLERSYNKKILDLENEVSGLNIEISNQGLFSMKKKTILVEKLNEKLKSLDETRLELYNALVQLGGIVHMYEEMVSPKILFDCVKINDIIPFGKYNGKTLFWLILDINETGLLMCSQFGLFCSNLKSFQQNSLIHSLTLDERTKHFLFRTLDQSIVNSINLLDENMVKQVLPKNFDRQLWYVENGVVKSGSWWLAEEGGFFESAKYVDQNGVISSFGASVDEIKWIRPVLRISFDTK